MQVSATAVRYPDLQAIDVLVDQIGHHQGSLAELQARCERVHHSEDPQYEEKAAQVLHAAQPLLSQNARKLELEMRWVSLGLPGKVLKGPWKCIETLFSSGIAYQLSAYAKLAPEKEAVRWNEEKQEVEILFEGVFISWTEFDAAYQWSKTRDAFIGRQDPKKELTMTAAPQGFIQKSRYTYSEPFPIATLSAEQHLQVRQQAALYDGRKELPDSVLQIYTSPGGFSGPSWLVEAFAETGNVPSHYGVRLIDSKGDVYSFGYMMDPMEETAWGSPLRLASTVKSCIAIADYDEWRKFGKRYVTSLPLSHEVAHNVMHYVSERQNGGLNVFNLGRENCASFTRDVMNAAGYETPDLKVGVGRFFSGLIIAPLKAIPGVSHLWRLGERIFSCVGALLSSVSSCPPGPLQRMISHLKAPLSWVTDKVIGIVKWIFAWVLGGKKISPYVQKMVGNKAEPFLLSWKDMFRYDATDMVSSEALVEWQKKQNSTKEFSYRGPELTVV